MFSVVTARSAAIVKRKLKETLTSTESEITYKKLTRGRFVENCACFALWRAKRTSVQWGNRHRLTALCS